MNVNNEARTPRLVKILIICCAVAALSCGLFALSGCAQQTASESSGSSSSSASSSSLSAASTSADEEAASSSDSSTAEETSSSESETASDSSASEAPADEALDYQTDKHPIVFTVEADGYSDSDGKIPIAVTGTDADGNFVDATAYIDCNGEGLSLAAGTYTVTVIESPLCANGLFFEPPTDSWTIKVSSDLASGESVEASPTMKFTKVDPSTVSSSAITTAYKYAISGGLSKSTAKEYRSELQNS